MQASNLLEWEKYLGFQTLGDEALVAVLSKAKDFCLDFKGNERARWLTILGDTGTGKTHLCNQIWKKLWYRCNWLQTTFHPHRIYWPDFVSQLKSGNVYDKFDEMKRWPILFLDDVGAERDTTGFSSDKLNELMGCRMDKWTMVTSNLRLEHLAKVDPRIADRIIRQPNEFIEVNTVSYALRQIESRQPHND